jgi:peptidoglycan/LPS O-acetylase OafA/YrhL
MGQGEWKPNYVWDAVALCLWPLLWYLGRNAGHVLLPFVVVVLYLAAFRGRVCSAVFGNRVITNIGGMCYSIYLFHFLIIYFVKHNTAPLHLGNNFWVYYVLQAGMIVPVVLFLCGAFFVLIERPCMDKEWPQKLWRFVQTFMQSNFGRQGKQGSAAEAALQSAEKPPPPRAEQLRADQ